MGQIALKEWKKWLIEVSRSFPMGQNCRKNMKNCPIERRYGTNCFEKMEKMSHRSETCLPYGTKPQLKQGKLSHRTTLWDKLL
jgi:hypothetical protein